MEAKKDTKGKLNYELDFEFIKGMAERMAMNKDEYELYNWQKPMDVEKIDNAITRHLMEIRTGNLDEDGQELGHYYALACNAMFAVYQLKNQTKNTVETEKEETFKSQSKIDYSDFKKGDRVIITDRGNTYMSGFTLNKEYVLHKDLNQKNGFFVEKDNNGDLNGTLIPFKWGMQFKKLSKNEYYINRQRFIHDDGEGHPLEIVSLIENESVIKGKRYSAYKYNGGKYTKGCSCFTITNEIMNILKLKEPQGKERFFIVTKRQNA